MAAYVGFTEEQFMALDDFLTELAEGGGSTLIEKSITANGTYSAEDDNADGYSEVTVNVSGGGGGGVEPKDVNFIDYDGTVLHAYTAAEFAALTALPENPSHDGIVAQGWNWTLADAKESVADTGMLVIGQMYVTESGDTEIDIELHEGRLSPYLGFAVNGTVTIDWGDGSTPDTVTGTSTTTQKRTRHDYAAPGRYTIVVHVVSGSVVLVGTNDYTILSKNSSSLYNYVYSSSVKAVRIGDAVTIGSYAFNACYSLRYITIPRGPSRIPDNAFSYCYGLTSLTIPSSATDVGDYAFRQCTALKFLSIPSGMRTIGNNALRQCSSLTSIVIPSFVTSISDYAFHQCYALAAVVIPDSVTSIANSLFYYNQSLASLTIPDSVTTIGSSAVNSCHGLAEIHFRRSTPPTVANANAFGTLPTDCKIYVPTGSLSAYTSASNYPSASTYTYVEE